MHSVNAKKSTASGRVSFDDRGRAVWEWRTDEDQFSRDVDTNRLKALQVDALELDTTASSVRPAAGFDPYNHSRGSATAAPEKRRSLDDLRRLSEQIKRAKSATSK